MVNQVAIQVALVVPDGGDSASVVGRHVRLNGFGKCEKRPALTADEATAEVRTPLAVADEGYRLRSLLVGSSPPDEARVGRADERRQDLLPNGPTNRIDSA